MEFQPHEWKLIRNKLPDVVLERDTRRMDVRSVDGDEHRAFLFRKASEEAREVAGADVETFVGEIADVRQVLADLCSVSGIAAADLRVERPRALPSEPDARRALFRERVDRLVDLADALPRAESEKIAVVDMLEAIECITELANIRDAVRAALAAKFAEFGGFNPGVAWRIPGR